MRTIKKVKFFLSSFLWFFTKPDVSGVKCIIFNNKDILFIRNSYGHGLWTFPGGSIENNESAEKAVRSEVYEEVGVRLENLQYQYIGNFYIKDHFRNVNVNCFKGECRDKKLTLDEDEILEANWFSSDNIPKDVSPYVNMAMSKLK